MASDREIITVQVGAASNFVGTHWWNIQESSFVYDRKKAEEDETRLNHDVLFREGKNVHNKPTYTPRLVLIDFEDNVGRTNLSRNLYPEPKPATSLSDHTGIVITQPSKPKNQFLSDLEAQEKHQEDGGRSTFGTRVEDKYYNLDHSISTWTDFLRVRLHPKSLLTCESLNVHGLMSRFEDGESLWSNGNLLDEFENRLRFFAEDSNCLQGFHFLGDIHDGMAGISSELAQYIRDEYPRNTIFASAILPSSLDLQNACNFDQYVWNVANGVAAFGTHCTVTLPLSTAGKLWKRPSEQRRFGLLNYQAGLPYHTSAIIAASLETATAPWRRRLQFENLAHICDTLNFDGRRFASLATTLPLGINEATSLQEYLQTTGRQEDNFLVSLTPYASVSMNDDQFVQQRPSSLFNISLRGVKDILSKSSLSIPDKPANRCLAATELLMEWYKTKETTASVNTIYEPVSTKSPYPNIFGHTIGKNGLIGSKRLQDQGVANAPVLTQLESSIRAMEFLNVAIEEVEKLNWQKLKVHKDAKDQLSNKLMDFL